MTSSLYFQALPSRRSEWTLFYVDFKFNQTEILPVHVAAEHLDFEELLKEKKRLGGFGIRSYQFYKKPRSMLFAVSSSLYMCRDHVLPSVSIDVLLYSMVICNVGAKSAGKEENQTRWGQEP